MVQLITLVLLFFGLFCIILRDIYIYIYIEREREREKDEEKEAVNSLVGIFDVNLFIQP